jgi:hypothetical protein
MLNANVPEGTILLVIESAAWRGNVELDASIGALAELRRQGATEQILNSVLAAEAAQRARMARAKVLAARPSGLPPRHGVYYRRDSAWLSLPSSFLTSRLAINWIGFRGDGYRLDLPGRHARCQLLDNRPTFYVSDYEPEGPWQIFSLSKKRNRRELRVSSRSAFPWEVEINADAFRGIEISAATAGVFAIRPRSDLEAGEYALCQVVQGTRSSFRCYEFGVAPDKPGGRPGARSPS